MRSDEAILLHGFNHGSLAFWFAPPISLAGPSDSRSAGAFRLDTACKHQHSGASSGFPRGDKCDETTP